MKQLELLEQELRMLQENIERIKLYQKNKENVSNYQSRVVGEFKHRIVAIKQRLTLVSKMNTSDLFRKGGLQWQVFKGKKWTVWAKRFCTW